VTKNEICLKFGFTALAILLLLSFFIIGCGGYRKFTVRSGVGGCSFEYPSSYARPSIDRFDDSTSVFASTYSREKDPPPDAFIAVTLMKKSDSFPDYRALLEYELSIAQVGQASEFKLVNRSPIAVAGVQGEQIVYHYVRFQSTDLFTVSKRIPAIRHSAYFEKDSRLWDITVDSRADIAVQAIADFEHIMNSFKFLD
jgi:hypothetical protein